MSPRIQLAALMAVMGVGILIWAFYKPDARKVDPPEISARPSRASSPTAPARVIATPVQAPVKPAVEPAPPVVREVEPDEAPAEPPPAEVVEAQGPFEVSLGHHTLFLNDLERDPKEGRVARADVILIARDAEGRAEIGHRRQKLVRMLYHLGARRNADAARGAAGKRRFEADFLERVNNVMKSSVVLDARFDGYTVGPRPE